MREIKNRINDSLSGAGRIALLGIGSELRGDDAAGMMVAERLKGRVPGETFKVFFGNTAPESLTGEIRKFSPTHLIMVDSAEMGMPPGSMALVDPADTGGISFSTHRMPVHLLADYLRQSMSCQVVFIGIQPKSLEFGSAPCQQVEEAVKGLCELLLETLRCRTGKGRDV